jgi:hypothetical protein
MTESKKPRQMTAKMFLHRSSGKVSADAFIQAHRAFLETGKLAEVTSPILAKLDSKAIMPTPALEEIRGVVFTHTLRAAIETDEAKMAEAQANPAKAKPWMATIYDAKGDIVTHRNEKGEEVELQQGFEEAARADGWVDRRLFEGASDWYGVVSHTTITIKGEPMSSTIQRADAIARIMKHAKGAVMKVTSKTTSKLGFGVKCGNDRAVFSRG